MPERRMTPDELRRFEEEVVQHSDQLPEDSGPASEPEVAKTQEPPKPPLPVNPD